MLHFRVGPLAYPVGSAAFLGSFFDTIAVLLEGGVRGSRYPALASLYETAELAPERAGEAREHLADVASRLRAFTPAEVVWDMDDPARRPPWGDEIAPTILTLDDYHVTSDGRKLVAVLDAALDAASRVSKPLRIQ